MKIGFAGTGRMGAAMAGRLQAAGFGLLVWNRSPSKIPAGLTAAATLNELVERSDILLSILANDAATLEVHHKMLAGPAAGKLFVEMGTVRQDTIRQLAQWCEAAGARFAEAPVLGTVAPARQGQLVTLVGGEPALFQQLEPVLAAFSRRVIHCGPIGQAMAMKHFINNVMSIYFAGLAEAVGAGQAAGLDLADMLSVLADTPAALPALAPKIDIIKGASQPVAFDVAGACKDLQVIIASAHANGATTPITENALQTFETVANSGRSQQDLAVVVRRYLKPDR